ncbi:MAG: hypothetical protein KC635_04960 [Myxococcales bacterium]|nr:hypothetical protein [Myxococcales bacterium]MCB9732320.1 hypothetical protein [Deltaproteobacteria bacterium]
MTPNRTDRPLLGLGTALGAVTAVALLAAGGCSSTPGASASALSSPIDFAYACGGDGAMHAPENDERAKSLGDTRMCPDLSGTASQGALYGVALNRYPAALVPIQLNPMFGTREFLDTDLFIPGITGIPVGADPIRVLTADDYSAFYVVSAGSRDVSRAVITGTGEFTSYELDTFDLPGVPVDAVTAPGELIVAASDAAELWVYDLDADPIAPPLTVVDLPGGDAARRVIRAGDDLLVTWRSRPVVTRLALDGAAGTATVVSEAGLVAACRDGLDDDGDGLVDQADPDCEDADDDDESADTGAPREASAPDNAPAYAGAAACDNGVDDDRDGHTDFPDDGACVSVGPNGEAVEVPDGEYLPECGDGLDNDGDGRIDFDAGGADGLADASCYAPFQTTERRLPVDGPFDPAWIDAGDAGRFVYVLDLRTNEIIVFSSGADGALTRVDVNAEEPEIPVIETYPWTDIGNVNESVAVPAVRPLAYQRQHQKNIVLGTPGVTSITASQTRGETWERIIPKGAGGEQPSLPFDLASGFWHPANCDAGREDVCEQPAEDDTSWFVYGARLDGRILQIEAVRRGVPVHRLAEQLINVAERNQDVSGPRLTRRGTFVSSRGEPAVGYAFLGAALEEVLVEAETSVRGARVRRYGIWPADDVEQVLDEDWTLTFEGRIPGTRRALGRMTSDTVLADPNATFCEDGVAVGDWLQLEVPIAATAPELVTRPTITNDRGEVCPTQDPDVALVEVRVTRVGMRELEVDPATARLRPTPPVLDLDAISAAGVSRRSCEQAQEAQDEILGTSEFLPSTDAFAAANLPPRFTYSVRVGDAWAVVGTKSGFLHRQVWDRTAGACVIDESLDARLTGRAVEADIDPAAKYVTCPPPPDALRSDTITDLAPASGRFENPSFALDVLPGCTITADGAIVAAESQQDTTWSFTVVGPHSGSTLAVSNSNLGVRVPILDFRRLPVQVDAGANRVSVLQVRPGKPSIIAVFE